MPLLRDGTVSEDPRLDRLIQFDERSRNFAIADVVPAEIKSHTWGVRGDHLDQGHEGACVGFGCSNELIAYPKAVEGIGGDFARKVYHEAQRNDPWPGGEYEGADPQYSGTSVIEGIKVIKSMGYIEEYRWAFNVDDIMRAISHEGPVVVGTSWLEGMDQWSPAGLITAEGMERGGHCYLLTGLTLKPRLKGHSKLGPVFRIHNSWGNDWARGGDAFITVEDFAKLMDDQGEAVIPMGRSKEPQQPSTTPASFPEPRGEVEVPDPPTNLSPKINSDPFAYWH